MAKSIILLDFNNEEAKKVKADLEKLLIALEADRSCFEIKNFSDKETNTKIYGFPAGGTAILYTPKRGMSVSLENEGSKYTASVRGAIILSGFPLKEDSEKIKKRIVADLAEYVLTSK